MCRGDAADSLCLRLRGEINGTVDLPPGGRKRLSTLTAGMSFGQRARVSDGQRSVDVPADTAVACGALSFAAFQAMAAARPVLMIRLLHRWLRGLGQAAVRLNAEVAALEA